YTYSTLDNFMIVNCGGCKINLTTWALINGKQLGEITKKSDDFCGSTFVDKEFIKFLRDKLGTDAIDRLIEYNYGQFQYTVQEFCRRVKIPFTGDDPDFLYDIDLEEICPIVKKYVSKEIRKIMRKNDWIIDIKY